jgi:hypothetical protein
MIENITKIREIENITNEPVNFMHYFSKKTINSLLDEKKLKN